MRKRQIKKNITRYYAPIIRAFEGAGVELFPSHPSEPMAAWIDHVNTAIASVMARDEFKGLPTPRAV